MHDLTEDETEWLQRQFILVRPQMEDPPDSFEDYIQMWVEGTGTVIGNASDHRYGAAIFEKLHECRED